MKITTNLWIIIICNVLPFGASARQNRLANKDKRKSALSTITPSINYDDFNIQNDIHTTAQSFRTDLLRIRRNISSVYIRDMKSRFNSQYQLRKLLRSIRPQKTLSKKSQQLRREKFIKYHKTKVSR